MQVQNFLSVEFALEILLFLLFLLDIMLPLMDDSLLVLPLGTANVFIHLFLMCECNSE